MAAYYVSPEAFARLNDTRSTAGRILAPIESRRSACDGGGADDECLRLSKLIAQQLPASWCARTTPAGSVRLHFVFCPVASGTARKVQKLATTHDTAHGDIFSSSRRVVICILYCEQKRHRVACRSLVQYFLRAVVPRLRGAVVLCVRVVYDKICSPRSRRSTRLPVRSTTAHELFTHQTASQCLRVLRCCGMINRSYSRCYRCGPLNNVPTRLC